MPAKTWRVNLITFFNAAKSGELAEAKEEYERYFGKAFPKQEETAADVWDEKCRGGRNSEPNKELRFTPPLASRGAGMGTGLEGVGRFGRVWLGLELTV